MTAQPAAFVHDAVTGTRMHVVIGGSTFTSFNRTEDMTNLECAERLAKGWRQHGRKVVVSEGEYEASPIGYSFSPEWVGIPTSAKDHNYPDYMDGREVVICNEILDRVLGKGYAIAVNDGEEWATKYTTSRMTIQRETAATDVTIYRIGKPRGVGYERLGDLVLIHGNHEDVLSDMNAPDSDKLDALEQLMTGIGE